MSGKGSALVKQLLIVSLSMVAILAACLSVQRYCNVVVHCTNATRASQIDSIRYAWLQQPTTDEMAYAIFGTGVAVGRQADSRYLDYIRTQIVRPSLLRPRTHLKPMNARKPHVVFALCKAYHTETCNKL